MDLLEAIIEKNIKHGEIYLSNVFKDIEHPKFFVIMGISEEEVIAFSLLIPI